jgi:hypothetical protein
MKLYSSTLLMGLAAAALLGSQSAAQAQSATIYGALGNFDVANNQQREAHGFEVELEGVQPQDIAGTFDTQRYGAATIASTATGVIVRWASPRAAGGGFLAATAPHRPNTPLVGTCYQWAGVGYDASGCEHFGVHLTVNATRSTYRWLVADLVSPDALVPGPIPVVVALPAYSIAAPTSGSNLPVLNADVDAPGGAVFPTHYGDAFWIKVYRTQLNRSVTLGELTNDNPGVVPEDAAHLETTWTLSQADPLIKFSSGKTKQSRQRTRNSSAVSAGTHAVVRRYEVYQYTGVYDQVFHQALCANSNCASPRADEIGDLLSAQMTAALLDNATVAAVTPTTPPPAPPSNPATVKLSVGISNKGSVTTTTGAINCPGSCSATVAAGSTVTLAAAPTVAPFVSWGGACAGTQPTCTLTVTKDTQVQATFGK